MTHSHKLLRNICWTLFVCWMGAIFFLSSRTGAQLKPWMLPIPQWDKVCHIIAFSTGAILLAMALRCSTALKPRTIILLVILLISFFGVTDEYHQLYTPGRSAMDVWDWLADTTGATLGALVSNYVANRRKGRKDALDGKSADARDAAPARD